MSTIVDYGTLKTAVSDWINRSDTGTVNRIPDFISFAEGDIYRGFRTQTGNLALRCRDNLVKASLVPVDGIVTIPSDFRELKEVTMADKGITPISDQFYNRLQNYAGQTQVFSLRDTDWYQYPNSDTTDTFDVIYYADFSGTLVNDTDTNPILLAMPDVYLFGALQYAEKFIKNDSRAASWMADFDSMIRGANADARRAEYSGATMAQRTQYREVHNTRTHDQNN